jgi:hypothetical protein
MKKVLTVIFALFVLNCHSQNTFTETDGVYIGAGFNVGWGSSLDSNGYKTEYKARALGVYFPVGYRVNNWLFEASAQYTGALIGSLTIGRVISLSETVNVQLMAGLADNFIVSKNPLVVKQQFSYNFTGRLQIGDFYFQAMQIQHNTYLGIGFIGLMNLTTY